MRECIESDKERGLIDVSSIPSESKLSNIKKFRDDLDEEELKSKQQDRSERKVYAKLSFELVCFYLGAVFLLVYLSGKGALQLSEAVLLGIIATLAPNVLGIFYFVMKYLFKER